MLASLSTRSHLLRHNLKRRPPSPLPLPPPQTPQTPHLISECANFYVGLSFVLSTLSAPLYLRAVLNFKDKNDELFEKTDNFWSWTLLPINIGAMGIAFFLKPCQEKKRYKIILCLQCLLFVFVDKSIRFFFGGLSLPYYLTPSVLKPS